MVYNDNYFLSGESPYTIRPPERQQQPGAGAGGINPMQALQMYNQFGGASGASGAGAGGTGGGGGLSGLFGGGGAGTGAGGAASGATGASAAGGSGAGGAGTAAAASPLGWIAAAALAQNVAHNKGISSWQAGLKGQGGRNIGEHFMDQWGVDEDSKARDVAGLAGWGKGGGYLNPGNIMAKVFGSTK